MSKFVTHYDNLQVKESASEEVIKGSYKYLSHRWHPDRNPGNAAEAERVFKIINRAYFVLSDPIRRKEHDDWIRLQRFVSEAEAEAEAVVGCRSEQADNFGGGSGCQSGNFRSRNYGGQVRAHGLTRAPEPAVAALLEVIPAVFQFFGIGHIYAGRVGVGLLIMFSWWFVCLVNVFLTMIVIGYITWPLSWLCFVIVSSSMASRSARDWNLS